MAANPKRKSPAPAECPVCGADVPPNARACPGCGADERTGWNEDDTRYDGLDLPDSAFDDNNGEPRRTSSSGPQANRVALHWWFTAFALLALFVAIALRR